MKVRAVRVRTPRLPAEATVVAVVNFEPEKKGDRKYEF